MWAFTFTFTKATENLFGDNLTQDIKDIRVFPRPKFGGGDKKFFQNILDFLRGGINPQTSPDRPARGGDNGGGFQICGGGCRKRVVNGKSFGRPPEISGNFGKYWVKK